VASTGKTSVKQLNFGESKVKTSSYHECIPFCFCFFVRLSHYNPAGSPYAVHIRLVLQLCDGMRPCIGTFHITKAGIDDHFHFISRNTEYYSFISPFPPSSLTACVQMDTCALSPASWFGFGFSDNLGSICVR